MESTSSTPTRSHASPRPDARSGQSASHQPSATTAPARDRQGLLPTRWTRPLQIVTAVFSLIFTIGTALQNFVIVNEPMLVDTMQLAGLSSAEAAEGAPGFLTGFRLVGTVFIIGNALGMLALRGWSWVFWLAIVVNLAQAVGVVVIPPEVFQASINRYGLPGILPSVITDGGALILVVILIGSFVRFRAPWAQQHA